MKFERLVIRFISFWLDYKIFSWLEVEAEDLKDDCLKYLKEMEDINV